MSIEKSPNPTYVMRIKGNSLDDGPGIRSVIFFKGCNLKCMWCHNPESIAAFPELYYDSEKCVGCRSCVSICSHKALKFTDRLIIDRSRCQRCFSCIHKCNAAALQQIGQIIAIKSIIDQILPYRPFFQTSGGGVTLSGGEPTLNMPFLRLLLSALKEHDLHVLLETNGYFSFTQFQQEILPFIDVIYMDLKLMDSQTHQSYCGVPNHQILRNFELLWTLSQDLASHRCFQIIPRMPLIPTITDTETNLTALIEFLESLKVPTLHLLTNNALWFDKCDKFGYKRPFSENHPSSQIYPILKIHQIQKQFESSSVHLHII
jgi:pyruvate formate lyase activating enzyme